MKVNISVIGLGYVGLPLALRLSKFFNTIAFDINKQLISRLKKNIDLTNEVSKSLLASSKNIIYSNKENDIKKCNFFILTVPTPVDKKNKPDLRTLLKATKMVGKFLKKNDTIIIESTVYPSVTDEIIIPLLEKISKLKINKDFYVCYSPERANPGDSIHKLSNIPKIISGSSSKALNNIEKIYSKIISPKLVKVKNLRTAEAAKIIENTQRDVNIALINDFSIICKNLDINVNDVLNASLTKWNFLDFKPGLVGGHCISVDPYYLYYKARDLNLQATTIISARKVNEKMPKYIFDNINKIAKIKKINLHNSKILFFGASFKENCPDLRNSGSIILSKYFKKYNSSINFYDPLVKDTDNKKIKLINKIQNSYYDIIVYSVNHKIFKNVSIKKIKSFAKKKYIFVDLKFRFKSKDVDLYF